ncbi:MAG: hypothetical protein U0Q12_17545 [Vicinamibacterales bacterium]
MVSCAIAAFESGGPGLAQGAGPALPNAVLFVTQVPVPADFTTIGSVFGNHQSSLSAVARGGDLWIRYGDGSLKNLTQAAGLGSAGMQGANAIAVREPSVHWSGTKALFSMVVGAPTQQYQVQQYYWQIYEVTGLGPTDTPVITRVANQPPDHNNVSPIYGSDDRVIFTSDRPRNGQRHLYPQLDEYEEAPTVTGLWSLNPSTGDLFLVQHSPSGSFSPQIDSFGRLVYVRWDHLQRDQQADGDALHAAGYGTFNYSDETALATRLADRTEVFPEPRSERTDLLAGTNLEGHSFNDFFPWMINEDGTGEETLNHLGRHELHSYFNRSLKDDPNLREFIAGAVARTNTNAIENFLQIKEDPASPGTYFGVDAPEFTSHASGQIVKLNAAPLVNPDTTIVTYVTHRDTHLPTDTPSVNHSGLYRNPLPLANGTVVAVHTAETRVDANTGTRAAPGSRYAFRLKTLKPSGGFYAADQPLTGGISKTVSYWDPDVLVSYSGPLWELDPVEVRARTRPTHATPPLAPSVLQVFAQQGVSLATLQSYLRQNNLALIVSHNVTTRDAADRQQPFNLHVAGSSTQTTGAAGKIYDVSHLQLFQADQLRGLGGTASPRAGRRVIAQHLHDPAAKNPPVTGAPPASVAVGTDGSVAAFVPARRALSWQLTAPNGTPVVRERYWITMQPGEVRVCTSCHGINTNDQAGHPAPANEPEALRQLLGFWKSGAGTGAPPQALAVVRAGTGSGTIASSPSGVTCGADCSESYTAGTTVTLAASAAADSVFSGWSGAGCTGTGTCTVTMDAARTVTATFATTGQTRGLDHRYLAEGATGPFFDTRIALVNPGGSDSSATLHFLKADGTSVTQTLTVPPLSRRTVPVDTVDGLSNTAFATVVDADTPLVVDRTMEWGADGSASGAPYGSHAESSLPGPAVRWYLAEGATTDPFDLFYLLLNPSTSATTIRIRYLRASGAPIEKTYVVPALSRANVWVDQEEFPAGSGNRLLQSAEVSAVVESLDNVPIIVERAMYMSGGGQAFRAGHESAGVTAPATKWTLAEGATGDYFDLFVLVANPNAQDANVTATFLLPDGSTVQRPYVVGANQRLTIWVDLVDPLLANAAVSTVVESTNGVPVIVERSMWWPGSSATWSEAHNAAGSPSAGVRWAVADGEVGGPPMSTETYLLVANTSATAGAAKVTLVYEDGTAASVRTFPLLASSRLNVNVKVDFPEAIGKRFGAIVESVGSPTAQIVVERAMYSDAGGVHWAAGSNLLATKLQ